METSIWHAQPSIESINKLNQNTIGEHLQIEFTEVGKDYLVAEMPVDHRTKQPFGLLHGGANVVLAETLGSVASLLVVNSDIFMGVGIEINANHVKAVLSGKVKGVCKPIHVVGKNHVWDIKIYNDKDELSCVSRFTCTIVQKNKFITN